MEAAKKKPTRERLLETACALFAEKGFHNTTVAEICEQAEANIAAINYYFGDKESLYDEVWRHAFTMTKNTYPIDPPEELKDDAESALFHYAHAILQRIFCDEEAGLFPRLLHQEMSAPTLALDKIAREALLPQAQTVRASISKLLGDDCDPQTIWLCQRSIIGQCAFYNFSRPLRERIMGRATLSQAEVEEIARHIARFSLGGLKEYIES